MANVTPGRQIVDMAGLRVGGLVCVRPAGRRYSNGEAIWECRCDCGSLIERRRTTLLKGGSQSCGCLRPPPFTRKGATSPQPIAHDLTGRRFGLLTCVSPAAYRIHAGLVWICRCDCGKTIEVRGCLLMKRKLPSSCGCTRKGTGPVRSLEYRSWEAMRARCNQNCSEGRRVWKDYGARGITVCERWGSFANFVADMGPRPSKEYSIDRINNDLGYFPGNCRWATKREQVHNSRRAVRTPVPR